MHVLDKYRSKDLTDKLLEQIHREARGDYLLMEVCGGHTMAIHRYGLPALLPPGIRLLSGPGCPVCVTSRSFIDQAITLGADERMIICTYGDLLRVPGTKGTLEQARAIGLDVRVIYSPMEALALSKANTQRQVILLAIGFETTAPGTAIVLSEARKQDIANFSLLSALKVMPPAMRAVMQDGSNVQGFICPGHVSAITGAGIYEFLPARHGVACVVAGFEPVDILLSVLMLVRQINRRKPVVEIQYNRVVSMQGNLKARKAIQDVLVPCNAWWRGFGILKDSGLRPDQSFEAWDTAARFGLQEGIEEEEHGCICGEILKGKKTPGDCRLFGNTCTPANPIGACMVSGEGTCAAYYAYDRQ